MGKQGKRLEWDFELRLAKADRDKIPMTRLAEYLTQWALLLGPDHKPVFRGVVTGSIRLRAGVDGNSRLETSARIRNAPLDATTAPYVQRLEQMVAQDGFRYGRVTDREGQDLLRFVPAVRPVLPAITVTETTEIDGWVCRVEGRDRTTHIGLVETGSGRTISVQTTNDALAQRFARHFRGSAVRVRTHGTWTRNEDGLWEPKSLVADDFDELDEAPAIAVLEQLRAIPGNGWAELEDPDGACRELRGIPLDVVADDSKK